MDLRDNRQEAPFSAEVSESVFRLIEHSGVPEEGTTEAALRGHENTERVPIEELLTREEVMQILKCGKTTLGKLARRGTLVPGRVMSMVRYKRKDVAAFIESLWS